MKDAFACLVTEYPLLKGLEEKRSLGNEAQ